jgi:hypothetical protein
MKESMKDYLALVVVSLFVIVVIAAFIAAPFMIVVSIVSLPLLVLLWWALDRLGKPKD